MADNTNMRMMILREEGGKGGGQGAVMSQWKAWQRPLSYSGLSYDKLYTVTHIRIYHILAQV